MGDQTPVRPVLFHAFDFFRLGISPTDLLPLRVKIETIRYSQVVVNNHTSMSAVHIGAFDFGRLSVPVSPEYITVDWIERYSAWIRKVRFYEYFSEFTI